MTNKITPEQLDSMKPAEIEAEYNRIVVDLVVDEAQRAIEEAEFNDKWQSTEDE
jgi:hypothetical protein